MDSKSRTLRHRKVRHELGRPVDSTSTRTPMVDESRVTEARRGGEATRVAQEAPGMIGPWGQPVPVMAPAKSSAASGADNARAMLAQQFPRTDGGPNELPDRIYFI